MRIKCCVLLVLSFSLFILSCSSNTPNTFKDIGSDLKLLELNDRNYKVMQDGEPYTGVIYHTTVQGTQDSLIFNKYGYPKSGIWVKYGENNKDLIEKGYYDNGKKDSLWVEYHSNGQVFDEVYYNKGETNGKYISYFSDGSVKVKGTFKNGDQEGEWTFFNKNGTILKKGELRDDEMVGSWQLNGMTFHFEDEQEVNTGNAKTFTVNELNKMGEAVREDEVSGNYIFRFNHTLYRFELDDGIFHVQMSNDFYRERVSTSGTYNANFKVIDFDDGTKCLKFKLRDYEKRILGGDYQNMCYDWMKKEMYMEDKINDVYYGEL